MATEYIRAITADLGGGHRSAWCITADRVHCNEAQLSARVLRAHEQRYQHGDARIIAWNWYRLEHGWYVAPIGVRADDDTRYVYKVIERDDTQAKALRLRLVARCDQAGTLAHFFDPGSTLDAWCVSADFEPVTLRILTASLRD
ncbi:hypothetical protein D5S17_09305 [Pseudonocardiaceae bacterium YIM PH 21723]|nr:hypothetical protein D5S17_09305 [Pseudonocardiaceae bacterium YIM PH 21723]